MTYKTQGIIIKKQDWREYDRLFTFYTRDFGKIKAVAKGVKKIKSKLAGHLQEFALIDLFIANGRNIDQVGGALINKNFSTIRSNLYSVNTILSAFELVDQLVKEHQKDLGIYYLLNEFLEIFNSRINKKNLKSLLPIFNLKFLSQLGYRPELFNCTICKNKISDDKNYFSSKSGLVCFNCGKDEKLSSISKDLIKVLRFCLSNKLSDYLKININKNLEKELALLINQFIINHLDKELKVKVNF